MLLDIIATYDDATKQTLRDTRTAVVLWLAKEHDPKKILSFLSKCAIIGIDEKDQTVYLGIPNTFVSHQVKKFFIKDMQKAIKDVYNPHFTISPIDYPDLQHEHELHIPLKSLLHIKEKKEPLLDESTKAKLSGYFGILFESKYSFANFVVGANNQLAHSAAEAIAKQPGQVYNPFFIYGNVGLGKTHLMQAIGNSIMESAPEKTVLYLPTTKFIDEVVKGIRFNKLGSLMEKLDQVDVLMLDDIQFLAGKDKTQEIFHNIFNDFHSKQKQIVVTSDQPPKALTLLEARLQSRFALGLVADIKAPDMETRIAIIENKLRKKDEALDTDMVQLIATTVNSNVRELEGALNIIITKKQLLHQNITLDDVIDSLETLGFKTSGGQAYPASTKSIASTEHTRMSSPTGSQKSRLDTIVQKIALNYDIAAGDIIGKSRMKEVSFARQMAMYIAKTQFQRSLQKIGNYFGGKNHASVIYAIKTFEEHMQTEPELQKKLDQFI